MSQRILDDVGYGNEENFGFCIEELSYLLGKNIVVCEKGIWNCGGAPQEGMVFGSTVNKLEDDAEYVSDNSSILSLQPWIFRRDNYQVAKGNMAVNGEFSGKDVSGFDIGMNGSQAKRIQSHNVQLGCGFGGQMSSISSWRSSYSVMPLNMQNRILPQLYGDDFEVKEFVFNPAFPSSLPSRRPFYVTDGSHIISKSSYGSSESFHESEMCKTSNVVDLEDSVAGFSALPKLRKAKRKSPQIYRKGEGNSNEGRSLGSLLGTSDGLHLFCLGLCIGSAFTMTSRKREVDKLNEMLKHSQNLVQDLQEELELKDSLTVKDLISESSERQMLDNTTHTMQERSVLSHDDANVHSISQERDMFDLSFSDRTAENTESFSIIEAELEAELERLELNVGGSSFHEKTSLDESDEDQIAKLVHGELSIDKLARRHGEDEESHCNSRGSSTTRTPPPNYAVSPTELSLRLHELKQSRLEERIRELEAALAYSQRHVHFIDSEMMYSPNTSSDMGFSSNQESPTVPDQLAGMIEPLCINLSGDALDAYNEAYDEFMRMSEVEEKPPSPAPSGKIFGGDLFDDEGGQAEDVDGYGLGSLVSDDHPQAKKLVPKSLFEWDGHQVRNIKDDDIDDEEGRNLIQQIVERTRSGSSPFVLNVQKMLLSMDK